MKNSKKVLGIIVVICLMAAMLSGCTAAAEGKALYDAMIKAQTIKSSQSEIQFALRLDASGLSEQEQMSFAQVKAMADGASMSINMKQHTNDDNTAVKMQMDLGVSFGGMIINDMSIWADMDLNGDKPKFIEIIKPPAMLTAMEPSFAGKEYMVMDLGSAFAAQETDGQMAGANYADTIKLAKELQEKTLVFMGKYMAQYDPGFKFISYEGKSEVTTPEGIVNADIYGVKLDDKAAKKLLRYTVNNLANNKDVMEYAVEYIDFMKKFAVSAPEGVDPAAEMDKAMAEFEIKKPEILAQFNEAMDQIENIQLVGDKGITLEYAIDENGYIVSQSGSMDFVIDVAKLDAMTGVEDSAQTSSAIYTIGIDFSALIYDINKEMPIELPEVTPENSIDLNTMMQNSIPDQPAQEDLGVNL